jgi:hypothetical protein
MPCRPVSSRPMDTRWRVPDRRYSRGWRWTPAGRRAYRKWIALIAGWCFLVILAGFDQSLGPIVLLATLGLPGYAVYRHRVNARELQAATQPMELPQPAMTGSWTFNPAPGWPLPPPSFTYQPGWKPDPS